jgi:DNA-binding response OmpR family regulator/transcriptional regulator with XRE-family HTH domain
MPTILIIDDDVSLLARLGTELEQAGYDVLRVSETRSADLLIDERRPDLVLLDTDTSRGEGWEVLGRVVDRAPVIVISGRGLEEDIIRGLDAGAADYVPKPFRTGELLARIRVRLRDAGRKAELVASMPSTAPPATGPTTPLVEARPSAAAAPAGQASRRHPGEEKAEPVFITYGEEQRLIHDPPATEDDLRADEIAGLPLGQRLRAARQRKRITLVQAELESKVRMHYIQAMEEEKFSLLPRGTITEELLRAYAAYIGIDLGQALEEYRHFHFNAPIEPPAALGGSPLPRVLPRWVSRLVAALLALAIGLGGIWALDPGGLIALVGRARALVAPPVPLSAPTAAPQPTVVPTPQSGG